MAEQVDDGTARDRPKKLRPFDERINEIGCDQPWLWLAAGWRDFCRSARVGVPYALVFVVLGYVVTGGLYQLGETYLIWPMAAGFVMIAPAFCVGFYALSREMEAGGAPSWRCVFDAWKATTKPMLGAGLALVFFKIIWVRVAALIYVLFFPNALPTIESIANQTFFSADGLVFLAVGTSFGGALAFVAFLVSAVSPQIMMAEKGDFLPSVLISVFSVSYNPRPMILWAAIIVVATGVGMATAFVGLAVTLPLVGHASWHAYRAVVRPVSG